MPLADLKIVSEDTIEISLHSPEIQDGCHQVMWMHRLGNKCDSNMEVYQILMCVIDWVV